MVVPGFPGSLQHFMPGEQELQADPCEPGAHREDMPTRYANAAGAVVQDVMTLMPVLAPVALPPH